MIEYVTAQWNPYTGCKHTLAECPIADKCWARAMSKRFKQVCGGDFEPRFHPERLDAPLHWKKPRRVAVCFTGDLWGDWELPGWADEILLATRVIIRTMEHLHISRNQWLDCLRETILDVVEACPQHQFLFLTKRPETLVRFNPWPLNAWVGTSITGAETPQRQAAMLEALQAVEGAGVRWLSYEPVLGPLEQPIPAWLDWVVVGKQSGRGMTQFELRALQMVELWAGYTGKARWWKNSMSRYFLYTPLTQELPQQEQPHE